MGRAVGSFGPILLTGATGQVGSQLLQTLTALGEVVAPTRAEMDLGRPESVREVIRAVRPRWIVNPGAYTTVDKAESEPALAYLVNQESVGAIGEEAKRIGAAVIHFSTDYVFSGSGIAPYLETDVPAPVSVYGASKAGGEQALAASGAAHLIFRTSWIYGATGRNFLLTILKLAREREQLNVVADQFGAPTWSRDLARMTASVMEQCEAQALPEGPPVSQAASGIYHVTGAGETTWFGFANEAIRQTCKREPGARFATLSGITTAAYPTPAKRPGNSRLDCSKLARTFGWQMPAWEQSLAAVIEELSDRTSSEETNAYRAGASAVSRS